MKIFAVISEFNPFHNGHKYLIDTIKKDSDAAVVAIMSGSFVERGDVAVIDKYARAEAALMSGIDLVLELPAPWCFSGAELFALGGVSITDGIGAVDYLAFGSESGDIVKLEECAKRLASEEYAAAVEVGRETKREVNTAALRADVYADLYGEADIFDGSNNLLGLEYLQAINKLGSSLVPITVKRLGEEYNSTELGSFCSATSIRAAICRGETDMSAYMPTASEAVLRRECEASRLYSLSKLDTAVIAMLRAKAPSELAGIMEITGGFENKLCSAANSSKSIGELTEKVRSKHYSSSRIRRALISAMLGVTIKNAADMPLFTVLLGANERGREILAKARKRSRIDILSKMSDSRRLGDKAGKQFELHLRAERLAELCCAAEPRRVGAVMI